MSKSPLRVVDNEVEHPRDIARRKVKEWRSDAQKQRLGTVNQHDRGGKRLDVDDVINNSIPDHTRRK